MTEPLQPGDTIGILGGGQLGRMLAMSAARLGFETIIFAPGPDCPAAQVANDWIDAGYNDLAALDRLAEACDVITYEFENIPVSTVRHLNGTTPVFPGAKALETSQDRLSEKTCFNDLGIATAGFHAVDSASDLETGLDRFGGRGIIKTRQFGYDGKGQIRIDDGAQTDLQAVTDALGNVPSILEEFIAFEREISIIAARGMNGQIVYYDPAENVHEEGILRTSTLPARITQEQADAARVLARKSLEHLEYVGVMGIELFVETDGKLRVNEFAPRVHNSGHWTQAVCAVSQFEQHIRAIAGWPLGETSRQSDCEMVNIIGHDMDNLAQISAEPAVKLELYGKKDVKKGRKMGHFTRIFAPFTG